MKLKKVCLWLLIIAALFASAALAEKIQGITYTYPDEPGQDRDIPNQDPLQTKLVDGIIGGGGAGAVWGQWQGNKAIVRFDLKRRYKLSAIEIWTSEGLVNQHLGRVEILSSTDGSDYRRVGTLRNPQEPLKEKPLQDNIYSFCDKDLNFEARYVKLTFYQDNLTAGIYQQVIEEVCLWGEPLPFSYDSQMPPVEFTAEVNTYSSVRLEIGDYLQRNPQAADLRVFVAEEDFRDVEGKEEYRQWWYLNAQKQTVIVNGLTPNHTYYIAAAGVSAGDKQLRYLEPAAVRLPGVLAVEKVGDVFGVNAFPYIETGASHQRRSPEEEREMFQRQIKLAQEAGIKYNRWWRNYSSGLLPYVNAGITFLTGLQADEQYISQSNSYGTWFFEGGNEPNFAGTKPEEYVAIIKEGYKAIKAVNAENILAAPVVGPSDWLREFYEAGGKDYFDVMDTHLYPATASPVPEGLPKGAPEAILLAVQELKEIMADYHDADKPLIITETGSPTYTGRSWAVRGLSQEEQAQNIVRIYLHLIAGGFRRIFLYALQDEGTDLNNMEHNFGIVDYEGKPKLAYYAYQTMTGQLGETLFDGPLNGTENPYYGYQFKKLAQTGYISCLWDAAGKSEALLKLAAGEDEVIVYDLFGHGRELTAGEQLTLTISESPIYIHTKAPLVVQSAKRLPPPPTLKVAASLPSDVLLAGDNSSLNVSLNSTLPGTVRGTVSVEGEFQASPRDFEITDEAILELPLILPRNAAPGVYMLTIKVELPKQKVGSTNVSGVQELKLNFWLASPLGAKPTIYKQDFTGDGSEEILLTNEKLEALIAPEFGGRLILLIDKESKTNQLNADLKEFSTSCSGSGLGFWDALGTWTADLWRAKYDYQLVDSEQNIGVSMQATGQSGVVVSKQILLPDSSGCLNYKLKFFNPTNSELTINYTTHPEFTPGGVADSYSDVIYLPSKAEIRKYPYVSTLGDRGSAEVDQGWWAITDPKEKVMLGAVFDEKKVESIRQWWGDEAFNLELSLKPFRLAPKEEYAFDTLYFIKQSDDFQAIKEEWLKRR